MTVPLFTLLGRLSAALPPFRGKVRIFLLFYRLLGLSKRHIVLETRLRRPVAFRAELDLHAWLQRLAFLTGGYEEDTVDFLVRLHRFAGSGYLLDVGANIGLIAIPFAKLTGGRVVAVEAVPDNVIVLRHNVAANDLNDAITILPVGLGDEAKIVQIQVEGDLQAGEGTGTANILPDGSSYECVRQELRIERLDALALPDGCSVMKIDTDGYDLKVVMGGVEFLQRNRPIVFGEFSAHCLAWHGQSVEDVIAFARTHGYETWRRQGTSWRFAPFAESTDKFEQDLLLVPREKAAALRAGMGDG